MRYGKKNCGLVDIDLLKAESLFPYFYNNPWYLAL